MNGSTSNAQEDDRKASFFIWTTPLFYLCMPASDPAQVRSLFLAALAELQIPLPAKKGAAELLKVSYAQKVLAGTWSPRTAARKFVELQQTLHGEIADRQYVGDGLDIVAMIRAHYSYDDLANVPDQEGIDRMVLLECRRLARSAG